LSCQHHLYAMLSSAPPCVGQPLTQTSVQCLLRSSYAQALPRRSGITARAAAADDDVSFQSSRLVRLTGAVVAAATVALSRQRLARAEVPATKSDGSIAKAAGLKDDDKKIVTDLFQKALDAKTVEEEEAFWTKILDKYADVPEVGARVFCNRGNARSRQGKLELAISDYGRSIKIAPDQPDGYLNRGAIYEAVGKLEDAINDYDTVLAIDITDPAAWNNRGNALLGLGRWKEASKACKTALSYSGSQFQPIAAVNLNLAEYQLGNDNAVLKDLQLLLARFADAFPDARAFYALMLWERGDRVQAETEWDRATAVDPRYKEMDWVRDFRRWPPRLRGVLAKFAETTKVKVK